MTPRILRTGAPLTLEGIRHAAPAVFAEHAHDSRGPRYQYVPTIRPLEALMANNWGVYEVSQARPNAADRKSFCRHMLRLRRLQDFDVGNRDGVPELIIKNAHDGTSAYEMTAGFFRLVCSNGMVVGKQLTGFRVIHSVNKHTTDAILQNAESVVVDKFPKMMENIEAFKAKMLDYEQRLALAQDAMRLRYGSSLPPFEAEALLKVRRPIDAADDAWTVLNRIQENVLQGGWETRSIFSGRRSAVRPVEAVEPVLRINQGLWDKTLELVSA